MILNRKNKAAIVIFLAPAVTLVAIFVYAFLTWSVGVSLTDWNTIGRLGSFNGLKNYVELFSGDSVFTQSVWHTLLLAVIFIGITIPLGVLCAVLLDFGLKGRYIFRAIYLIPLSFSFVASATMWNWMYMPNNGVINTVLRTIGLDGLTQPWITSTDQALLSIAFVYVWQFSGFATLVYYSGISSVPQEVLDAAEVDGASVVQKYSRVVLPLQKPATMTVLLLLLMYSLRVFDFVWLMTGGGPAYASEVLASYMYRVTFDYNQFAYGASISTFMFLLSVVIIVLPVLVVSLAGRNGRGR